MTTLLSELNFLSEAESEIVKTIKNTAEFKKAAKLMKFISTPKELQNGTRVLTPQFLSRVDSLTLLTF
jgi:hypothetical protein